MQLLPLSSMRPDWLSDQLSRASADDAADVRMNRAAAILPYIIIWD